MPLTTQTRLWIHGLLAAFIGAFSTAASGAIALPTVFNFTHDGVMNMLKLSLVPAMTAVFTYLKQSPLPNTILGAGDTVTLKNPTINADSSVTADSATVQKAV